MVPDQTFCLFNFGDAAPYYTREDFNPVRVLASRISTCKQKESRPRTGCNKDIRAEPGAITSLDSCPERCAADHPLTDGFSESGGWSSVMYFAMNGALASAKAIVVPIRPKTLNVTHWSVV